MIEPQLTHQVILIGDSGNISLDGLDPVLDLLKQQLTHQEKTTVIFLGDNIYPKGLPDEGHELREDAEITLQKHYEALENFKGRIIFISGNHDWNKGKRNGLEYVLRQERYLEGLFGKGQMLFPSNGCAGPSEISINNELVVVAINTQWWLQSERPLGKEDGCANDTEEDFFVQLKEILDRNSHKRVLVIGHYPIYSYSMHGGRFNFKHHLFPLTIYKKEAFIPLPFIGSILPLYRRYIGLKEDLAHPKFQKLRKRLKATFRQYPGLIYAAGHEHNLQHIEKYANHYIVSGAASKFNYVKPGKYSKFGISAKGFFKLMVYDDESVRAQTWVTSMDVETGLKVYDEFILSPKVEQLPVKHA